MATNETVFETLDDTLRRLARSWAGPDAADDLTQKVMLLIVEKGLPLKMAAKDLTGWASQALHRVTGAHRRATRRERARTVALDAAPEIDERPAAAHSPQEHLEAQARAAALARAMRCLTEEQQQIIQKLTEGASREEIVAALGVRTGAAWRLKLWRAKRRFQKALAAEGYAV
ncbi:MAG: sigma-70 family RNA polymerase sigma factor [Acidobacteria bacterium]|nr:sigma-70 family RNA polymerase sigma factor [Acidobacteriota bacterium]